MPISPHLLRKLHETLGAEAAEDLASRLEAMDANRGDIGELRHEMQLGFTRVDARFASLEAKFDQKSATLEAKFDQRFATLEAKFDQRFAALDEKFVTFDERFAKSHAQMEALLQKGLREQTRFFFLAWSVLLAAIVGLYAR